MDGRLVQRRSPAAAKLICRGTVVGYSFARIGEEELITVGIIDHQEPVAPRALLNRNALGFKFDTQTVQRVDLGLSRMRLDVEGNEHQSFADLLRPMVGNDKGAALPLRLRYTRSPVFLIAPGTREAEPVHIKAERCLNVAYVQDWAGEPVCHSEISSMDDNFISDS